MHREDGFTLVELMTVMALMAVLLTLSAIAVRHFMFVQTLSTSTDTVTTQMRQAQQQSESESHPLVYGVWFINVGDSTRWGTLQYDPAKASPCTEIGKRQFEKGVEVKSVSFAVDPVRTSACRTALGSAEVDESASAQIAFFYARGTATPGSITLEQTNLDRTESLKVTGITGRVDEL
jgi:prepilin-type N-terminal cleavage/methylation domain-containing protein